MSQPDRPNAAELIDWGAVVAQWPEAVVICDSRGRLRFVNRAAERLLDVSGAQRGEFASLAQAYPAAFAQRLREEAFPAALRGVIWEGRLRLTSAMRDSTTDGSTSDHSATGDSATNDSATGAPATIETEVRVFAVKSGGESLLVISQRPAADQSELAEALAEARARKRSILESSLDPIVSINHEGVIIEFNRAAEQVFGYPRGRVLGTRPAELLFPPELADDQQKRIDRYLAAEEGSMLGKRAEVVARRADGRTFPAELAMVISREGGSPILTFFIRDISQAKSDAAERARHEAELERSNQDLQQFAYVASHDLQEPLRKIKVFSERLRKQHAEHLDELGHQCLERIQSAAVRMQSLIDGLLTLSRVATGGLKFEPVNLEQVARDVVADLEAQIERAGARVEIERLPTIQADPLQMRQLFQNLIGNALKFRRPDEPPLVRVSGRFVHRRGERPAGSRPEDETVRILVEDNGIGFDNGDAERIFGVFQRLHPREAYEGTGMGLAICRRIVERHGGTITARGKPGVGSTFEVLLPVVPPSGRRVEGGSSGPSDDDIVY